MAKRVSLTKAQRESEIGAELLVLCQSMTEDGKLSGDEIKELVRWLREHRTEELPAIEFLVETVERIIADGVVTPDERKELHVAVEKILPPEIRQPAADRRKAIETAKKERDRPIDSANFMVAGVHYEGRGDIIERCVNEGDVAYLARDRANAHSRHAIEVRIHDGQQIGYVPEDFAEELAPALDRGVLHRAYVTKLLTQSRVPIPVVQAYLYRSDAKVDRVVAEKDVPSRVTQSPITAAQIDRPSGIWERLRRGFGF